jgi:sulfopyruvate decarboxylase subunit alpha
MRKDAAALAVEGLKAAGVDTIVVLSESWLFEVHRLIEADPFFTVIPVSNEGDGVSICAGMWLGGKRCAILMENSGLRVACEALARLQGLPVLLLMSYRGDWGDPPWWAASMGATTEPLLKALRIPYTVVRRDEDVVRKLKQAVNSQNAYRSHVALVFGGELI